MNFLGVFYYLIILLGMLAAIWKYVIMDPAAMQESSDRRLRKGLPLMAGFLAVNFLAEFLVGFIVPSATYNHFIYIPGLVVSGVLLLLFYAVLIRGWLLKLFAAATAMFFISHYFLHSLWRPAVVATYNETTVYYALMAVGSLLFLISSLRTFKGTMRRHAVGFGIAGSVYFLVGLLLMHLEFAAHAPNGSPPVRLLGWINLVLVFFYYTGILANIALLPDKAAATAKPRLALNK